MPPGYIRIIQTDTARRISSDDIAPLRQNKVAILPDKPATHPIRNCRGRHILDFGSAPAESESDSVYSSNEPRSLCIVGKRTADFTDHNVQIRFHDVAVGPDLPEEIFFCDDVRPACKQDTEQVERFRGQMNLLPVTQQLPGV